MLGEHLRLDALLGQGEAGTIYNAWDLRLNKACAVKVLRPELCALTTALLRLRHDNREIARLLHPHLQAQEMTTLPDGVVVLHRDLWYGETLRQRLLDGPLDAAEISRLFGALCGALQAAHNQGVLHGDLKPENLLLGVPAGSLNEHEPTLRVLDFGMHHLRTSEGGIGLHPLLGPLSYLAPEQVQQGAHALELRSDLFALGALLYECATGQPAFAAAAEDAAGSSVLTKICLSPTPLPSQARQSGAAPLPARRGPTSAGEEPLPPKLAPPVLRRLDAVVARACHKDAAERYSSPESLWAGLAEALLGDGEEPGRSTPPRARSLGNKNVGARAIELFKQLEISGRHQRDEPSQEIRRSAAVEAAQLLDRARADAEVDAAGEAWRDAGGASADPADHPDPNDPTAPPRPSAAAEPPEDVTAPLSPKGTAPFTTVPAADAASGPPPAEAPAAVERSGRTVNTQPSLRPVRATVPLRSIRVSVDPSQSAGFTPIRRDATPTAPAVDSARLAAEEAELLAAIRPPLWWRLMPLIVGVLVVAALILLSVRGR